MKLLLIFIIIFLVLSFYIITQKKKYYKNNPLYLDYYISLKRNYSVYISSTRKIKWIKVTNTSDSFYITDEGKVKKNKVKSFCVLYPSGEILQISENLLNIPNGAYWIEENKGIGFDKLMKDEVDLNSSKIIIENKKSNNPSKIYYSTEILNNMNCKIYPIAFGGYKLIGNEFILNNVIDTAYSAKQFINWYGCNNEFVLPGEKVCDPNNYGDGDLYWIYIFKTEFDEILKIGVQL